MSPPRLDAVCKELRELMDAARPGPWHNNSLCGDHRIQERGVYFAFCEPCHVGAMNARLIAAMRNALPQLLDAAEQLRRIQEGMAVEMKVDDSVTYGANAWPGAAAMKAQLQTENRDWYDAVCAANEQVAALQAQVAAVSKEPSADEGDK